MKIRTYGSDTDVKRLRERPLPESDDAWNTHGRLTSTEVEREENPKMIDFLPRLAREFATVELILDSAGLKPRGRRSNTVVVDEIRETTKTSFFFSFFSDL